MRFGGSKVKVKIDTTDSERRKRRRTESNRQNCIGNNFHTISRDMQVEMAFHTSHKSKNTTQIKANMYLRFLLINRVHYFASWVVPHNANVVLDDERTKNQYEIIAIPKYAENVVDCLSNPFLPREKWIEHTLTAVLAILIDHESQLKVDGPENFEEHVLLDVVGRLLCRAIKDGRINSIAPLSISDVVDISQDVFDEAATTWGTGTTFVRKFVAVKRELMKLDYIPASLWQAIQDESIVLPIAGQYHAIEEEDDDEMVVRLPL